MVKLDMVPSFLFSTQSYQSEDGAVHADQSFSYLTALHDNKQAYDESTLALFLVERI